MQYRYYFRKIKSFIIRLMENLKKALRQRQIAEEIHRRKQQLGDRTLLDDERTLLSLMKAGDQKGARHRKQP